MLSRERGILDRLQSYPPQDKDLNSDFEAVFIGDCHLHFFILCFGFISGIFFLICEILIKYIINNYKQKKLFKNKIRNHNKNRESYLRIMYCK